MEEKKLDINSIIGFVLIALILIYMLYQNRPTPEELQAQEEARQEQVEAEKIAEDSKDEFKATTSDFTATQTNDSTQIAALKNKIGSFAYSASLSSAQDATTILENDVLKITVNNKGGYFAEVQLKEFVNHDSIPVYLIKDENAIFNLNFGTNDNRTLNTQELYFQPSLTKSGDNQILSMKLKVSETQFLEYRYELKPSDYMLGFSVRSQGLQNVINSSQDVRLDWKLKGRRHAKSITYENRYTRLTYEHENGDKVSKLSQAGDDDEVETDVNWLSYRQHFFSSILLTDKPFNTVSLTSETLAIDEEIDTLFTKSYSASIPLQLNGGS